MYLANSPSRGASRTSLETSSRRDGRTQNKTGVPIQIRSRATRTELPSSCQDLLAETRVQFPQPLLNTSSYDTETLITSRPGESEYTWHRQPSVAHNSPARHPEDHACAHASTGVPRLPLDLSKLRSDNEARTEDNYLKFRLGSLKRRRRVGRLPGRVHPRFLARSTQGGASRNIQKKTRVYTARFSTFSSLENMG